MKVFVVGASGHTLDFSGKFQRVKMGLNPLLTAHRFLGNLFTSSAAWR